MHTMHLKVGKTVYTVHHNADWSGQAIMRWEHRDGQGQEVRLPGKLLMACGRNAAIDVAIDALESLYVAEGGKES